MKSRCGVEIEFVLTDHSVTDVMENLSENGLEARHENYNHETRRWWKLTTDSSCGLELVSPILTAQTYRSTRGAMTAISTAGGAVNRQCGFHVHIEPERSISPDEAIEVVDLYNNAYDDILSHMLSSSRKDNGFCTRQPTSWYEDGYGRDERYVAVNLTSLDRYGTIEFRQHQGTLNATKALTWIQMMDCLTSVALSGGTLEHYKTALRSCLSSHNFSYALGRGIEL